jgi:hypothetical protein
MVAGVLASLAELEPLIMRAFLPTGPIDENRRTQRT